MKIGIDVGGSHIGLGIVDTNGKLLLKKAKDYETIEQDMSQIVIHTIIDLIKESDIDLKQIESIGIAVPGTISQGTIVKADNLGIYNLDIEKELKKVFNMPINLQNDAKCAAVAEKKIGSLKDYDDAMFLIIGTGVGGAVFLDGKLLKPKRYSGFEVGHMLIKENGEKCGCGRKGCFESYGSMKRFKEKIKNKFNLPDIDGKRIEDFMRENKANKELETIIDEYIDDLATGITNLVNIFEPEATALGGSFAYYQDLLLDKLKTRIIEKDELFNKQKEINLVVAELKNDAGIIGAAMI